jgi:DNA-directed RNA polymerase subunit RPC12/RpoP
MDNKLDIRFPGGMMIPKNLAVLYVDIQCGECGRPVAMSNTIQHRLKYYCPRCSKSLLEGKVEEITWIDEDKEVTDDHWGLLFEGADNLENLKDELSRDLYHMTREEAWAKGVCIQCKEPAQAKCYSEAGLREYYQISALCGRCFDTITREEE